jgi:hypothetical protein
MDCDWHLASLWSARPQGLVAILDTFWPFGKQSPSRPLLASEAQVAVVRKLHKGGTPLRDIMIETNLTFA